MLRYCLCLLLVSAVLGYSKYSRRVEVVCDMYRTPGGCALQPLQHALAAALDHDTKVLPNGTFFIPCDGDASIDIWTSAARVTIEAGHAEFRPTDNRDYDRSCLILQFLNTRRNAERGHAIIGGIFNLPYMTIFTVDSIKIVDASFPYYRRANDRLARVSIICTAGDLSLVRLSGEHRTFTAHAERVAVVANGVYPFRSELCGCVMMTTSVDRCVPYSAYICDDCRPVKCFAKGIREVPMIINEQANTSVTSPMAAAGDEVPPPTPINTTASCPPTEPVVLTEPVLSNNVYADNAYNTAVSIARRDADVRVAYTFGASMGLILAGVISMVIDLREIYRRARETAMGYRAVSLKVCTPIISDNKNMVQGTLLPAPMRAAAPAESPIRSVQDASSIVGCSRAVAFNTLVLTFVAYCLLMSVVMFAHQYGDHRVGGFLGIGWLNTLAVFCGVTALLALLQLCLENINRTRRTQQSGTEGYDLPGSRTNSGDVAHAKESA